MSWIESLFLSSDCWIFILLLKLSRLRILNFDCHLDGTEKSHGNKSLNMSVKISVNILYMDWVPILNRKEK